MPVPSQSEAAPAAKFPASREFLKKSVLPVPEMRTPPIVIGGITAEGVIDQSY